MDSYAQPFYASQDAQTGHFVFLSVLPSLRVMPTSTAIVDLLGFDNSAAVNGGTALTQWLDAQSPSNNEGKLWHATKTGTLGVPRSLEVHVPGIVQASYDKNGRQVGAQVASSSSSLRSSSCHHFVPPMRQPPMRQPPMRQPPHATRDHTSRPVSWRAVLPLRGFAWPIACSL